MFELLRIAIALIGSTAAGLWDLKTTDIPDWVCVLMAVSGIGLFAVEGWLTGDYSGLTMSLVVGGLLAAFGIGMYLTGQWGGGDGELMAAIGILIPFWPLAAKSIFPSPIAFFINVFFIGAIYTIIYAGLVAYKSPKMRASIHKAIKADKIFMPLTLGAAVGFLFLWFLTGFVWLILLPVLAVTLPLLYHMLKAVENGFYVRISTKKLKAGDMLGEDIPKIRLGKLHIRGLTEKEIKKIRAARSSVLIREGVRFGPVFPIALVVTLVIGDFVTFIMLLA